MCRSRDGQSESEEYTRIMKTSKPTPFLCSSRMMITVMCFCAVSTMMCLRLNMSVAIVCMVNHTHIAASKTSYDSNNDSSSSIIITGSKSNNNSSISSSLVIEAAENESQPIYSHVSSSIEKTLTTPSASSGHQNTKDQALTSHCVADADVNASSVDQEDGPLTWDKGEQGQVLGAYYYGYVISQVPAGWIVRKIGGKRLILASSLVASVTCLCIPVVAFHSVVGVVFLRVLTGILGGMTCPAAQHVISQWSPPPERSTMGAFTFAGFPLGTLITFPITGVLCQYGYAEGWPSVFYTFGILGLLFCLIWAVLVSENPESHRRITEAEMEYIHTSLHGTVEERKHSLTIPWRGILTSLPVYAVMVAGIATDFVGNIFLLYMPTYLAEVMYFDISANGMVSSLPYIFCFLSLNFTGYFSDLLVKKTRLTQTAVRKVCFGFGNLLCIGSLLIIGFIDCDQPHIAVALLVLSVAGIGCMTINYYVNPLDIAPEYSGILVALACTVANVASFISPAVVGAITSQGPALESWRVVFLMSAGVGGVALLFYIIFASGEVQPWAKLSHDKNLGVSDSDEDESGRETGHSMKYSRNITHVDDPSPADNLMNGAL